MRRGSKFLNFSGSSPSGPHRISKLQAYEAYKEVAYIIQAIINHDWDQRLIEKRGKDLKRVRSKNTIPTSKNKDKRKNHFVNICTGLKENVTNLIRKKKT